MWNEINKFYDDKLKSALGNISINFDRLIVFPNGAGGNFFSLLLKYDDINNQVDLKRISKEQKFSQELGPNEHTISNVYFFWLDHDIVTNYEYQINNWNNFEPKLYDKGIFELKNRLVTYKDPNFLSELTFEKNKIESREGIDDEDLLHSLLDNKKDLDLFLNTALTHFYPFLSSCWFKSTSYKQIFEIEVDLDIMWFCNLLAKIKTELAPNVFNVSFSYKLKSIFNLNKKLNNDWDEVELEKVEYELKKFSNSSLIQKINSQCLLFYRIFFSRLTYPNRPFEEIINREFSELFDSSLLGEKRFNEKNIWTKENWIQKFGNKNIETINYVNTFFKLSNKNYSSDNIKKYSEENISLVRDLLIFINKFRDVSGYIKQIDRLALYLKNG